MTTAELMKVTKKAAPKLALCSAREKNEALHAMADALLAHSEAILTANREDTAQAQGHITEVMLDRLRLDEGRIRGMAQGMREVADLPDPVGKVLTEQKRPNGLVIRKVTVPLGVVAIIYESRPNVTSDAAALALKSGNGCILRSGKEAYRSSAAIVDAMKEGLEAAGLDPDFVGLVSDTTHESAAELMTGVGYIDLLIPRGGAGLIRRCVESAKVPCLQTGTGICHIYVDRDADAEKALAIIENAKKSRPSVCNAAEVCLVHRDIAGQFLPRLKERLQSGEHPVTLYCDEGAYAVIGGERATEDSFRTEFLDYKMAVALVDGVEQAISHIAEHSTGHSESIITENSEAAVRFLNAVDSAAVYHNASTRFTDGGEFGLGCEMGISTQKLHARGPVGLGELVSYKYQILGNGQIR